MGSDPEPYTIQMSAHIIILSEILDKDFSLLPFTCIILKITVVYVLLWKKKDLSNRNDSNSGYVFPYID